MSDEKRDAYEKLMKNAPASAKNLFKEGRKLDRAKKRAEWKAKHLKTDGTAN